MKKRLSKHLIFVIFAFACPLIAFIVTLAYQQYANSVHWRSLTDKEGTTDAAGAMLAFGEFIQLIFFTLIGCAVGIIFAILSFCFWRRAKRRMVTE
jgi:ABC-type phosphate transport system permease subunit